VSPGRVGNGGSRLAAHRARQVKEARRHGQRAKGSVGMILPATVDAMGIARLLDGQQPDNMIRPLSALAEEVSKNNDLKQVKAKQIFLGIDAMVNRSITARSGTTSTLTLMLGFF
jgi:hypothetical protein